MRLLFIILSVFVLICTIMGAGFVWIGQQAPKEFSFSITVDIAAKPEVVWAALTNVGTFVERYDEISLVELLEVDDKGALRWKIQRGDTSVIIYRRVEAEKPQSLRVAIDGGNMGIEGSYIYNLAAKNTGETVLTAREETIIDAIVLRAAFVFAGGREQILRRQIAEIKKISEAQ